MDQDYPQSLQDWTDAATAINGGVMPQDAIEPNPLPIRDTTAMYAAIWEELTDSPWTYQSYFEPLPMWGTAEPFVMEGTLSDGTTFDAMIQWWLPFSTTELAANANASAAQEITTLQINAPFVSLDISTAHGLTTAMFLYYEWDNASGGRAAKMFPVRFDQAIYISRSAPNMGGPIGSILGCPTCTNCVMTEAFQSCLDTADSNYDTCMGGIIPDVAKGAVGFLGGPLPGVITILVTISVDALACDASWQDDFETCVNSHCSSGWYDNAGHFHWELR